MAVLSPPPKLQFFDANGVPLVGGKLYSYAAGTTTPLATYTSASETTFNTNPIILNSRGEAEVWLGSPLYKFKLTTAADVEIWTVDNIGAAQIADAAVTTAKLADAAVTTAKLAFDGGALSGMRNLIINGNPVINQRVYVSGTATAGANQYTLDRWRVVTSGQSVSWTDSAGIRTVTAPAGGMEQVIEALNNLGGVHTLSWTGTATATVNGASVANGGQVTLTGNTDVTIRMLGGTWSQLQLEQGSIATPFERRQYGAELALCQRYYEAETAGGPTNNDGLFSAGAAATAFTAFNTTKRATPTMTYTDLALNANRFSDLGGGVHNQVPTSGSPISIITANGFFNDFGASGSALNRWRILYAASAEL